jgi:hypothetical protein
MPSMLMYSIVLMSHPALQICMHAELVERSACL